MLLQTPRSAKIDFVVFLCQMTHILVGQSQVERQFSCIETMENEAYNMENSEDFKYFSCLYFTWFIFYMVLQFQIFFNPQPGHPKFRNLASQFHHNCDFGMQQVWFWDIRIVEIRCACFGLKTPFNFASILLVCIYTNAHLLN